MKLEQVKQDWQGRVDDPKDPTTYRWHQVIQILDLNQDRPWDENEKLPVVFIGFCSDEGVKRNKGRIGARKGPAALRRAMSNLSYLAPLRALQFWDAGNVEAQVGELEEAQLSLGQKLAKIMEWGGFPIILGGGHEVAYGHFLGYSLCRKAESLGIINLDAHFDLRQPQPSPSSGTPFWQIAQAQKEKAFPFNYTCLGINPAANTDRLIQTAHSFLVEWVEVNDYPLAYKSIDALIEKCQDCLITLDLDVFSAAFAPGVSAPAGWGWSDEQVIKLLVYLATKAKVKSLDIAELNPDWDQDGKTAKLAAHCIFYFLMEIVKNRG